MSVASKVSLCVLCDMASIPQPSLLARPHRDAPLADNLTRGALSWMGWRTWCDGCVVYPSAPSFHLANLLAARTFLPILVRDIPPSLKRCLLSGPTRPGGRALDGQSIDGLGEADRAYV